MCKHDREAIDLAIYEQTETLRGQRVICDTVDELVDVVADELVEAARLRVSKAGVFHLALSGGSTPKALFTRMIIDPKYRIFPWHKTHIWIVDDRCVAEDDERLNGKMIREMIVDQVKMPVENFHPMGVLASAGDEDYESELHTQLDNEKVGGRLDYALLGMGGDGHTASLFPQTPGLGESDRWVVFNDGELVAEPRPRLTMTYPLINSARQISVLVTGKGKHERLVDVAQAGKDIERVPISGVIPTADDVDLVWYMDHAAATGREVSEDGGSGRDDSISLAE